MTRTLWLALVCATALTSPAFAQDHDHSAMDHAPVTPAPTPTPTSTPTPAPVDHSAMDHGPAAPTPAPTPAPVDHTAMDHGPSAPAPTPVDHATMDHGAPTSDQPGEGSGTARLPANENAMHGVHLATGEWMVMAHGSVSLQYTNHSGPRGDDKLYATSMGMLSGTREAGWGRIQLKSMFSLEPAMDANGYPNLFASGETAGGQPLIDRQHPHDLFMELTARVDVNVGNGRVFLYGGPVGEPALGPSAFMHRASAAYNPEPPITHHWFDSTHITYGVVTAGYATNKVQFEASAFRGQEPDEDRWDIETPRLDSWSVRGTWTPTPSLALQASYGEIEQPETLHPGEDEHRFTASGHYNDGKGLSAMLAFSNKQRVPGDALTAWLAEANWDIDSHNTLFGRFENVANDELFPDHLHPLHDQTFRVSKFQAGYARRLPLGPFELALGGSVAAYAKPAALDPFYGSNPIGYTLFAKLTLGH